MAGGNYDHTCIDPSLPRNPSWKRVHDRGLQQGKLGCDFRSVAIALAARFLLNLLGVGICAAVLDPATSDNPDASTVSIGGGIWFVLAGIIAAFLGGYVSCRLSGRPSNSTGGYHGLTTWAVTTLVVLDLLTTSVGVLFRGLAYCAALPCWVRLNNWLDLTILLI